MTDINRDYFAADDEIGTESLAPVEPGDVGSELRAARQSRKIAISKVATDLKIREDFLLSIENGRYSDLPGIPYAIGYIRTYATYLGLDAEDLVVRFKEETQGLHEEPDLSFPMPVREGRLGGPALIGLSLVLAGLAYGAWYYYSQSNEEALAARNPAAASTTAAGPADPANTAPATGEDPASATRTTPAETQRAAVPPPNPGAEPAERSARTGPDAPAVRATPPAGRIRLDATAGAIASATLPAPVAPEPVVSQPIRADAAAPVEAEPKAETGDPGASILAGELSARAVSSLAPLPSATAETASGKANGMATVPGATAPGAKASGTTAQAAAANAPRPAVRLRATGLTWIRVHGSDGKPMISRVLRPGAQVELPREAGLTLNVGRANRLEIVVGENVVPAMRADSLPVYDVSLDPAELLKQR